MVMPCVFDQDRIRLEAAERLTNLNGWKELPAVQMDEVLLFNGRIPTPHGPRVVDVQEGLTKAMHPQRFNGISDGEILVKDLPSRCTSALPLAFNQSNWIRWSRGRRETNNWDRDVIIGN